LALQADLYVDFLALDREKTTILCYTMEMAPSLKIRLRPLLQLASCALIFVLALAVKPLQSYGSSWGPTFLVNTEAFQTIDDSDTASNVVLRFGDGLREQILYDRTNLRFAFSRSVKIGGALTVTGATILNVGNTTATPDTGLALEVIGTASGTNLFATKSITGTSIQVNGTFGGAGLTDCSNATNSKLLWSSGTKQFSCGTDQSGAGGGGGAFTTTGALFTNFANRFVDQGGDSMTGSLIIKNNGFLNASGSVITNNNIALNSDNGAVDAVITFGNVLTPATITYSNATKRFDFTQEIHTSSNVTASGNIIVTNNLKVDGATLFADGINNKVGIGTLVPETALEVIGAMSGRLIRAQNRLEASGALVIGGTKTLKPSATQVISAAGNSVLANAAMVVVDPSSDLTLTSTPTIADGFLGQTIVISAPNNETNKLVLQDQDTLASSNIELGTTAREITAKKTLTLLFDGTDWIEQAYTTESMDLQTFTTPGANTWTRPNGAKLVTVRVCGGGGGGGGGQGAAVSAVRSGGGGGGGGYCTTNTFSAADVGASVTVTIGAGGASVAGGTTAAGTDGNFGGTTSFGSLLLGYGGGGGAGHTAGTGGGGGGGATTVGQSVAAATGGTGGTCFGTTTAVGTSSITCSGAGGGSLTVGGGAIFAGAGGAGSPSTGSTGTAGGISFWSGGGGGGGGGVNAANPGTNTAGGAGGNTGGDQTTTSGGGGAGGTVAACGSGGNGVAGTDASTTEAGKGGGGGASINNGTGCTGGAGGRGGGGGGGGGGGTNIGGASGKGGDGQAWVWTSF
jgi:hypothetical protein